MKTCRRCKLAKSIDDFEKLTSHNCKPCKDEAYKIKIKNNNERLKTLKDKPVPEGKKICPNCHACRDIDLFNGPNDVTFNTCERCRSVGREYSKRKDVQERNSALRKEKRYWVTYRERQRSENEKEYLAKNAERMRQWRNNNPEHYKEKCRTNLRQHLTAIKRQAKKKGIPVEMTDDELLAVMKLSCTYCNFLDPKGFGGIDRMNNNAGYTHSNTTPCCHRCNWSKIALDPVTYWERCASITHLHTQGELFSYYRGAWPQRSSVPGSFCQYKNRAETKRVAFDLTKESYAEITSKPCTYCHRVDSSGLDRVLPYGDYSPENLVPACAECNYMRRDVSVDDFYEHCQRVAQHMESSSVLDELRRLNIPRTIACLQRRVIQGKAESSHAQSEDDEDDPDDIPPEDRWIEPEDIDPDDPSSSSGP